ncbi:mucin-5AC, partial [Nematolebias whitei]|uniref:mucin-5AC n=1 Tax=Nematolebias whitei TaxID=451745 RepID=UPI0018979E0C
MMTCSNPSGRCYNKLPALEGCYPTCPPERPYLEEVTMKCVSNVECGCYDNDGKHYEEGESMPTKDHCHKCYCSSTVRECVYDVKACKCSYNGHIYDYNQTVYDTHDGDGACIIGVCGENETIIRIMQPCTTITPITTVFIFTTRETTTKMPTTRTTVQIPTVTTQAVTSILTFSMPKVTTRRTITPSKEIPTMRVTTEKPTATSKLITTPIHTTTVSKETATTKQPTTLIKTHTTTPYIETPSTTAHVETPTTTPYIETSTTPSDCYICNWSNWINNDYPEPGLDEGDYEKITNISNLDLSGCRKPLEIKCRARLYIDIPLNELGQNVVCNPTDGLICNNRDQGITPVCYDYEIQVMCCV